MRVPSFMRQFVRSVYHFCITPFGSPESGLLMASLIQRSDVYLRPKWCRVVQTPSFKGSQRQELRARLVHWAVRSLRSVGVVAAHLDPAVWEAPSLGMCIGRRRAMNWFYIIGAVISVLLLIYLSVALLWPEKFS